MVDLGGYVIVLVEKDGKIKLFGKFKEMISDATNHPIRINSGASSKPGSAAERNDCDEILEM